MNAKEMFEELGMKYTKGRGYGITYQDDFYNDLVIYPDGTVVTNKEITLGFHNAIHQQLIEMGLLV